MNPPFRITHIATSPHDGAGIAASRQHEALRRIGIDSRFLSTASPVENSADYAAMPACPSPFLQRQLNRLPFFAEAVTAFDKEISAALSSTTTDEKPELFSSPYSRCTPEKHVWTQTADIIHLHWISGFVDYPRFFSTVAKPLVWTLHDQNPYLGGFHYTTDRDRAPSLHSLDARCLRIKQDALRNRRPLCVIGNSRWNTAAARASGFFPENTRFETIYYPLDATRYSPRDKAAAKSALGLSSSRFVVGFACTSLDNPRKGFADLLAALRQIEETGTTPLALLSFGRSPGARTASLLRSPWTHLGFLENDLLKAAVYSAMDVFVIPSRAEAFGQTAIEALACGTPVIGASAGGIPETFPSSATDCLFPPGDSPSLARVITRLQATPDRRRELAELGRQHVLAQHDPVRIASALQRIYAELLTSSSPSRTE